MSVAVQRARQAEADDADVLSVNVFAGFSLADVPWAGVSVVVTLPLFFHLNRDNDACGRLD